MGECGLGLLGICLVADVFYCMVLGVVGVGFDVWDGHFLGIECSLVLMCWMVVVCLCCCGV